MVTLYASASAVQARARQLDPVKVLVVLISVVPWLLFAALRVVWFAVSILIAAGLEGWDAAGRRLPAGRTESRGG